MQWLPRFLVTLLLSVGVAMLLSYLPRLENGATSPLYRAAKAESVSDANIVDVMSGMRLNERIRRVEVTHAIVSVDVLASSSSTKEEIMGDVHMITQTLFRRSTNINQVLIRVLNGSTGRTGPTLLLAADAARDKWERSGADADQLTPREMEQYLQSSLRMTYTPLWRELFDIKS
ncbi:hypothetical protein [Paenibacillus xerothermodurans]|uniref:Uncharacterized protein n=1 Tax=Paenibacillus xerothermodurans TaxID=1977292 RepID=A0A2W1NFW4_PAEXE|nr:hypothetical protein [Paenibacillus xerothermodurans]PZE21951.1 hypothetical protein CBW46_006000 [Paenibacillus xerothermodurans]